MTQQHPINIRLIDHVVVRTENLKRTVDFYCDVLGCRVERGPGELRLVQLRAGNSLIDLAGVAGPLGKDRGGIPEHGAQNMDHFCVQGESRDADAIVLHPKEHGVDAGQPVARCGALGNGPSLYIQDPEGNTIELKGSSSIAWRARRRAAQSQVSGNDRRLAGLASEPTGRARSEPKANEGRQGGFAGRSPARLVGPARFELATS